MTARAAHTLLSRRALLTQGGALVVTFAVASRAIDADAAAKPDGKSVSPDEVAGFISIDARGQVTISASATAETGMTQLRSASP